jgi:hypothetical protein
MHHYLREVREGEGKVRGEGGGGRKRRGECVKHDENVLLDTGIPWAFHLLKY